MPSGLERTIKTWRRRRSDERLFRNLCVAHRLEGRQRRLLLALADRYRLVRSSEIFVRPSLFASSPDREVWSNEELRDLRSNLFAPIPSPPSETVPSGTVPTGSVPTPIDRGDKTADEPPVASDSDVAELPAADLLVREAIDDPPLEGVVHATRD